MDHQQPEREPFPPRFTTVAQALPVALRWFATFEWAGSWWSWLWRNSAGVRFVVEAVAAVAIILGAWGVYEELQQRDTDRLTRNAQLIAQVADLAATDHKAAGAGIHAILALLASENVRFYDLYMAGANLRHARLSGIELPLSTLSDANLSKAEFNNSDFNRAMFENVDAEETHFIGAQLWRSEWEGAVLTNASFAGAMLESALLHDVSATSASFYEANLKNASLIGGDFTRANFAQANLHGADLLDADLRFARFGGASLMGSDLTGANLECAVLTAADLSGADLTGAALTGARLTGAMLKNTKVTQQQLDQACSRKGKAPPVLPKGLVWHGNACGKCPASVTSPSKVSSSQ